MRKPEGYADSDIFNVAVNGEIVAQCISREDADAELEAHRAKPTPRPFIQIYKAIWPIDKRPAMWRKAPLPRFPAA